MQPERDGFKYVCCCQILQCKYQAINQFVFFFFFFSPQVWKFSCYSSEMLKLRIQKYGTMALPISKHLSAGSRKITFTKAAECGAGRIPAENFRQVQLRLHLHVTCVEQSSHTAQICATELSPKSLHIFITFVCLNAGKGNDAK